MFQVKAKASIAKTKVKQSKEMSMRAQTKYVPMGNIEPAVLFIVAMCQLTSIL